MDKLPTYYRVQCEQPREEGLGQNLHKGTVSGNLDGSDDESQNELLELAVHRNFMGPEVSGLECVEGLGFNPSRPVVPKLPGPSLSTTLCPNQTKNK